MPATTLKVQEIVDQQKDLRQGWVRSLKNEVVATGVISEKTCEAVYDSFKRDIGLHDEKRIRQGQRTGKSSSMSPPLTEAKCLQTLEQNLKGKRVKEEDVKYVCKTVKQYIDENK